MKNIVLYPGQRYAVSKDVPVGFYCFFYKKEYHTEELAYGKSDDAELHMYLKRASFNHKVCYSHFDCAFVSLEAESIEIKNGIAFYYGTAKMHLPSLLHTTDFLDGNYWENGIPVFDDNLLSIKLLKKDSEVRVYSGDMNALLWNQVWFSVNSSIYWMTNMDVLTYKRYSSVTFGMQNTQQNKIFSFSENQCGLSLLHGREELYVCRFPIDYDAHESKVVWLLPDCVSQKLMYTPLSIREIHSDMFSKLRVLLQEYRNLGLDINIEEEINFFNCAPDLMHECYDFLSKCLLQKSKFDAKQKPKSTTVCFVVRATYDKQFYCAAKLADVAKLVEYDNARNLFYVTFNGINVNEISLMYYNLVNIVNGERKDLTNALKYLKKYSFLSYLQAEIDEYICKQEKQNGYSGKVTGSILISINKAIRKNRKVELDSLYSEMKKENRVATKWCSEYKLYMMTKNLIEDIQYQYRCEWLGTQSFDIFIPSQKVAIEYQGQQHYEPVSGFGGESRLEDNISRDLKKIELAEKNGITLLYWDYSMPINKENVRLFLDINKISYSIEKANDSSIITSIEMAPPNLARTSQKQKAPKTGQTRKPDRYIVQYALDGSFLEKYATVKEASTASGAGMSSINKVLSGERNSAGCYVWRKFVEEEIPAHISIDFDITKINSGLPNSK